LGGMMEIERKFLVASLPDLTSLGFKKLEQAYLSFEPEIRIRCVDNEYYLTEKSDGDLVRTEIERSIDNESYQILSNLIQSRIINKTRYYIKINSELTAELDIYYEELEGLATIEVEFKSEEEANNFVVPDWFGKEITYDERYKNKNLARCSSEEIKLLLD